MAYFHLKLVAPRPTFAFDMTDAEKAVMARHVEYWNGLVDAGTAVLFGPVMDPAGPFGLAIVEAADEAAARALMEQDPVAQAGLGFRVESCTMRIGSLRKNP
jgi:uncharacterized protein YciI